MENFNSRNPYDILMDYELLEWPYCLHKKSHEWVM